MLQTAKSRLTICGAILLWTFAGVPVAADSAPPPKSPAFNVSVSGSDRNPGTKAAPFATMAWAHEALRAYKKTGAGPLVVEVRQDDYALERPLVFTPRDSAPIAQIRGTDGPEPRSSI